MFAENSLDWSIGEALAFGSLLKEGYIMQKSLENIMEISRNKISKIQINLF
jgi:2-oxoglutarate dehydrogenase complex dehydrogenase (E1) component-like enzyme